ncbi:uncharacterized protein LOC135477727 [Liolophura sinensis]|uniref:uncharacterized protein LOC135477727 n=1 Tax=Liolophura sinensis TaxID=3198878 RepID=UPI003157F5AC
MSNAEAMRRYRLRMMADAEKHEAWKQAERDRYQKRKQAGKLQHISQLPPREQRSLRRTWKLKKRESRRESGPDSASTSQTAVLETPPQSPETVPDPPLVRRPVPSHQRLAGRRKLRRDSRRAYRTIDKQKDTIKKLQNQVKALKIKLNKNSRQDSDTTSVIDATSSSSPATRADAIMQSGNKDAIRKQLTYGFALSTEVKQKLKSSIKTQRHMQAVHRLLTGKLLKKYRLIDKARREMDLKRWQLEKESESAFGTGSLFDGKRKHTKKEVEDIVKSFYLEDVNSTPSAGKRETITRNKLKMQKRYLSDSMLNLFEKFKAEHPNVDVSYTTFTRLRPFYVVLPSVHLRDTVTCKIHHNFEFKATKLHSLGVLVHCDPLNVIKDIVCSTKQKNCMYQQCEKCREKLGDMYKNIEKKSSDEVVTYYEWQNCYEDRVSAQGKQISVKVVKKVQQRATIAALCQLFEAELAILMPHQYRIFHQFTAIKDIKQRLAEDECVLQIDFSENYSCKAATEIQSMHFGGSRKQISLHTCHATFKDGIKCYCTVSEDIRHSAESAWAHLSPVLDDLSARGIRVLHFVSDGPTTQYRNKTNFYLLSTLPFTKWGFQRLTYNFLEAAHGKGPADGIGAAVKNGADRLVAQGEDVLSVTQLIESLKNLNVTLYEVSSGQINTIVQDVQKSCLRPVKGTMKVHQLMTALPHEGTVFYREISCFCNSAPYPGFCDCYSKEKFEVEFTNSKILRIEKNLSQEQIVKFEKRLEEGYDITIQDLGSLDYDARQEYLYWTAWRAVKLQETEQNSDLEDIEDQADETDEEWKPTKYNQQNQPHNSTAMFPEINKIYAVFFHARGSKKGTFYLGRVMKTDGEVADMKFLERKYGNGNLYDWPRRDDISTINTSFILQKVEFTGPPPFALTDLEYKVIIGKVQKFDLGRTSISDK